MSNPEKLRSILVLREMLTILNIYFQNTEPTSLIVEADHRTQFLDTFCEKCTQSSDGFGYRITVDSNDQFENFNNYTTFKYTKSVVKKFIASHCIVQSYSLARLETFGTHYVVSAVQYQYMVIKSNGTYSGVLMDTLDILARHLKFSYTITEPLTSGWGARQSNGSWSGIMGDVVTGRADIGLNEFAITWLRSVDVDFLPSLRSTAWAIVSLKKAQTYESALIKPLSNLIWVTWIITILLYSILCTILLSCSIKYVSSSNLILGTFTEILSTQLKQGIIGSSAILQYSVTARTFGFWGLFTIMMTSLYSSKLYVNLLTGSKPPTIDTLEQLVTHSPAKIYLIEVSMTCRQLKISNNY